MESPAVFQGKAQTNFSLQMAYLFYPIRSFNSLFANDVVLREYPELSIPHSSNLVSHVLTYFQNFTLILQHLLLAHINAVHLAPYLDARIARTIMWKSNNFGLKCLQCPKLLPKTSWSGLFWLYSGARL